MVEAGENLPGPEGTEALRSPLDEVKKLLHTINTFEGSKLVELMSVVLDKVNLVQSEINIHRMNNG